MAATLGITGNWGIANEQTGILISELAFEYTQQEKTVLNPSGEIQGISFYQPKVEIKISGLISKTSAFSGKLATVLVLANAIPAHLTPTGGTTIITQISRSLANEDFEKIDITATHYPFVVVV
jgi:hypothetical protein